MNEVYEEWLVRRKTPGWFYGALPAAILGTVILGILGAMFIPYIGFIFWIFPAIGVYFLSQRKIVEYEYIFVTGELTIDRILNESRRKRMKAIDMSSVSVIAALDTHELDGQMGNSQIKKIDYTSQEPGRRIFGVLASEQGVSQIYLIEPSAKMMAAIKKTAPRKVVM